MQETIFHAVSEITKIHGVNSRDTGVILILNLRGHLTFTYSHQISGDLDIPVAIN